MDELTQLRIQAMQMAIAYARDTPDADLMYLANAILKFITGQE